jgi:hypothetical protein
MESKFREILPAQGVWTVEDLADYLGLPPGIVQQRLSDLGIGVLAFSSRFKHRLVRLEDLKRQDAAHS